MSVQNYSISEVVPDFGHVFEAHAKKLALLYTDRKTFVVSFDLIGVNPQIANAIRRTVMDELKIKALIFDSGTVKTHVDYIIIDELLDRISTLPIGQDIPEGTILSLSCVNGGSEV